MRIKTRLLLLLIPAIFVTLALLTTLGYISSNRQSAKLAYVQAQSIANEQSALTFNKLRQAETAALSLASTILEMRASGLTNRESMTHIIKGVAASSKDFFGVWILFEPNGFDGKDSEYIGNEELGNAEGRANAYWVQKDGGLGYDLSDNYDHEPYYVTPKNAGRLVIVPPYRDMDTDDKTLMSTIAMPIIEKGRFLGSLGIDIDMEFIQALIESVKPYETGYAMLISDTGSIIAQPGSVGVSEELPRVPDDVRQKISQHQPFTTSERSILNGEQVDCFYTPVKLDSFDAPWYFMVALPTAKIVAESTKSLYIQLGIGIVALIVLFALVFYTANVVSRPLQRIVVHAQEVASGNYKSSLDPRGFVKELQELGSALGSMLASLLDTMQRVEQTSREAQLEAERARQAMSEAQKAREISEANGKAMLEVAGRVDAVSQTLHNTSIDLTDKIATAERETHEQNRLMEQTVKAISGMSDSIVRVSDNAGDAAKFTERAQERAGAGAQIVNKTLQAVDGIRRETEALGGQIEDLSKSTEAVGAILGLINDIADQTNLLALNAAIEAARAGEAGRGFAVVADEVRKLAEKTVQATQQVDQSIRGIRNSMRTSAEGVSRTIETVQSTVTLGLDAQTSLSDIVELVKGMTDQIHDIAGLCREQASTSEQVARTVEHLRQLSLSVSKAMNEGAAISSDLVPQAQELGSLVEQLTHK